MQVTLQPGRPAKRLLTLSGELLSGLLQQQAESKVTIMWPTNRWEHDICGFAETILGIKPYKRQRELLEAIQDNKMVACASGHRVAKSCSVAIAALWFHCTFPAARVPFTAPTSKQVSEVVWHEIRRLHAQSGVCYDCREAGFEDEVCPHSAKIGGTIRLRPSSGLRQKDGRQIFGFSAAKAGGATGIAGNLMLIVDEASEVENSIFEGLHGNRAGDSRMLLTANPTQLRGEFYDAFHKNKAGWKTLQISSYESPNVTGERHIPGLADPAWIEERKRAWGEQSNEFKTRVLGEWAQVDTEGAPVSLTKIKQANANNEAAHQNGVLTVGLDVASYSPDGRNDDTVISIGRGNKHLALETLSGYREAETVEKLFNLVDDYRQHAERPIVNLDFGGIGYKVAELIERHLDQHGGVIELRKIRSNERARIDKKLLHSQRDQMFQCLINYLEGGGGLLRSEDLEEQLPAHRWIIRNTDGLATLNDKARIRKTLGRSPDQADALMLMCLRGDQSDGTPTGSRARALTPTYSSFGGGDRGSRYDQQRRRRGH